MKKSKLRSASAVRKNAASREVSVAQKIGGSKVKEIPAKSGTKTPAKSKSRAAKRPKTGTPPKASSKVRELKKSPKTLKPNLAVQNPPQGQKGTTSAVSSRPRRASVKPVAPAEVHTLISVGAALLQQQQNPAKRSGLVTSTARHPAGSTSKPPLNLPPILLEGDELSPQPAAAPVTGPIPVQQGWVGEAPPETDVVPEAYGTGKLYLVARDPDCVYAHWDLSPEKQQSYNALSSDKHLVLRVFVRATEGKPVREVHLHPESQSWFVFVDAVDTVFVAELGYYSRAGEWLSIAESAPVVTPPSAPSPEKNVQFGMMSRIPGDPTTGVLETPIPLVASVVAAHHQGVLELAGTASGVHGGGRFVPESFTDFSAEPMGETPPPLGFGLLPVLGVQIPAYAPGAVPAETQNRQPEFADIEWTEDMERALEEISIITPGSGATSSLETIEASRILRERERAAISKVPAEEAESAPVFSPVDRAGQLEAISSELGQPPPTESRFWLNVNAELVVYGATEPSASVTIGGRPIKLRPDGTFSYRFALPDGWYQLPITAVSVDGHQRHVALNFSRNTVSTGEVGAHPQDPALRPPEVENLA